MKPLAVVIAQLASLFLAATIFAQGTSWQPSSMPPLSFDRAAAARIYPDKSGNNILGLIAFKDITESLTVTKMRMEQKSRMVTHPETGEELEQTYSVCVPYSEVVERTKIISRRFEVPLENAKFWTIGGKSLSSNEAVKTLAKTRRCFSIEYQPRFYNYTGDPFFAEMLKDDVLVIWYDKDKIKEIPAQEQLSTLWSELHLDVPPPKFNEANQASLRAILKLATHPEATTDFLAGKLRPVKMTKKELLSLLSDLGSAKEAQWQKAYEKLTYVDPRFVMGLEELFELEQVQNYPARSRLADVLMRYPIDAPYSMTNRDESMSIRIEKGSIVWGKLTDGKFNKRGEFSSTIGNGRTVEEHFRILHSLALLESFNSPKANELIKLMASGNPKAPVTQVALSILEIGSSGPATGTVSELWADLAGGTSFNTQLDMLKFRQRASLALLKLAKQPTQTTEFLAGKLVPITIAEEECLALLSDLASDDEDKWRGAYGKLLFLDPRLVMSVEELVELEQFQNYPARNRLFDLLLGTPIDRQPTSPWQDAKYIGLEKQDSDQCFYITWETDYRSTMNAGDLDTPRSPNWRPLADALILLESFNTPEANELIESMAKGHPKAMPTQVARSILEKRNVSTIEPPEPYRITD